MKIFIVNICANHGSTGKIATILKEGYAKNGHYVRLFYGSRNEVSSDVKDLKITRPYESYISAFVQGLTGYSGVFLSRATNRLIKCIEKESPDVVQLLNIHGFYLNEYKLLNYLAAKQIPVVYSMMDEYAYMGICAFSYDCNKFMSSCGNCPIKNNFPSRSYLFDRSGYYFEKKKKCYSKFTSLHFAAVPWAVSRSKQSALLKNEDVRTVNEPIDLDNDFYPQDTSLIKKELAIPEQNIVVLTVAVLSSPRKGGKYFLDLCRRMQNKKGYTFIYVGYDTDIYEAPDNMIKIPYVSSTKRLAELFSLADVFVSTTLSDTIPNACINALGCGTPICGFDISGLSFIGINDFAIVKLVHPFDIGALEGAVCSFSKKNSSIVKRCRDSVYYDYSPEKVISDYLEIFEEIRIK